MADLNKILIDSEGIKEKWTNYLAFPYARAYAKALIQFKETKGAQDKLSAQRAEFGLLALTICSGGVLTHVFAQTAWKAVAANKALNVICNNNMQKAFSVAHFASNNKVANFVVGAVWDTGSKVIDDKTKTLFEENSVNFPSTQQWLTETDALTSLMGFVIECYLKYQDTARNIFNNSKLTTAERDDAASKLTGSKFANPPSQSTVNEARVAMEIELLFYLRVVMDLDFVQQITGGVAGGVGGSVTPGPKVDIKPMPGSPEYPQPYNRSHATPQGIGTIDVQQIGYNPLGRAFYDKINTLHTTLYGNNMLSSRNWDDFFNATMNQEAFMAANRAISTLESAGMTRFQQSIH